MKTGSKRPANKNKGGNKNPNKQIAVKKVSDGRTLHINTSPPTMSNYRNHPKKSVKRSTAIKNSLLNNQTQMDLNRLIDLTTPTNDRFCSKINNCQDIYSKVEIASNLLRSRSADRQRSAISKYERRGNKYKNRINPNSKSPALRSPNSSQSLGKGYNSYLYQSKSPKVNIKSANSLLQSLKRDASIKSNSQSRSRKIGPKFPHNKKGVSQKRIINNGTKNSILDELGESKRDVSAENFSQKYLVPNKLSPNEKRKSSSGFIFEAENHSQEILKVQEKHKKLRSKFKRVIEDNKNLRVLNKGLNKVIDSIITYLTSLLNSSPQNRTANKILSILNSHHEEITKKSLKTRGDSILKDDLSTSLTLSVAERESYSSTTHLPVGKMTYKPLDRLLPKELGNLRTSKANKEKKIFHPKILDQKANLTTKLSIDVIQNPSIELKNVNSTLDGYRENLEKVDMILKGCTQKDLPRFSSLREVSNNTKPMQLRPNQMYSHRRPKLSGLLSQAKSGVSRNEQQIPQPKSYKETKENRDPYPSERRSFIGAETKLQTSNLVSLCDQLNNLSRAEEEDMPTPKESECNLDQATVDLDMSQTPSILMCRRNYTIKD
ncbi:unnamed protein product [Moneuplotes crassus]|uniref:Uncharacterized protein n=1 Tax=Euplotes crassus TaxID=5936 RepID=A0AAD2DAZ4_EUPCR|nr:unnamed protein product [Moneuplotes crassus]